MKEVQILNQGKTGWLNQAMNRQSSKSWLDTAEFLSVSAAVVGTVASGVSQQAIFATAPLSVSLALNLANRRRVDRFIQKNANESVQRLHQDFLELNDLFSNGIETIRQKLLAVPTAPEQIDFSPVEEVIDAVKAELETRLLELELVDVTSVRQGVDQLQSELSQLREQIQLLFQEEEQTRAIAANAEFDPAKMFDLDQLKPAEIGGAMTQSGIALPTGQSFTLTDSEIGTLQEWQNAMAQEVRTAVRTELQSAFPSMSAADASMIQERLLQLQTAIVQLQNRVQTPNFPELDTLQYQLERLNQRFEQQPAALESNLLDQRIEDLRTAIAQLSDEVKNPPANDDTALIFSAMRSLYERQNSMEQDFINVVRTEIQNSLANTNPVDSGALQSEVAELRGAIAQLQTRLQQTSQQPNEDFAAFQEQINHGIGQLRLEIAQVEGKVRDLSQQLPDFAAFQKQVKDGFSDLQETISQLRTDVRQTTPPPVDFTPLQKQMEQVNRRLEQLPAAFDSTPIEQRIDELNTNINQWRTENKTNPNEDSDFIFSAMRSLYERQNTLEQDITGAVRSEVQKQIAPLVAIDSDAIQEGISQLQTDVSKLKDQLQPPPPPKPVDLSPLQKQIDQINRRLEQLPPPFDPKPLEQQVGDLKATITSWRNEIENSPAQEDLKIFLSTMRGMYDRRGNKE